MITSFTAFLFNILANLSRRILKAELSKLTQRVQMAECDEIDLNRRIKALTDENSKLTQAGIQLSADYRETKAKLEDALLDAYGLHSQRRKDIDTINRMEQDITNLTQAFSDLKTDRDRLSRCIKNITETLELHQGITDADRAHAEKSISGMKRVPQPITDWRLNTFGADSGTTETPMNSSQKVT